MTAPTPGTYTVQSGDSYYRIAQQLNAKGSDVVRVVEQLQEQNGGKGLHPGDTLTITADMINLPPGSSPITPTGNNITAAENPAPAAAENPAPVANQTPVPTPQNTAPGATGGNDLLALLEQYIRMQMQTGQLDPSLLFFLGLGGQGGGLGGLFGGLFGQSAFGFNPFAGGLFGQGGGAFNPFGLGAFGGGSTNRAIGLAGLDPLNARSLAAQTAGFTFGLSGGDVLPFANPSVILGNLGITA